MGLAGANVFPCCGKEAVEIVEKPKDTHFPMTGEEEEIQPERKLLEQKPSFHGELEPDLTLIPDLEDTCEIEPVLDSATVSETDPDLEGSLRMSAQESCSTNSEPQGNNSSSLQSYMERMPTPETSRHWSTNSNYSYMNSVEEARVAPKHRSIHAQTSNHLFWADKFIQTSECSLQKATSTQCDQSGTETTTRCPEQESIPKDTLCSEKQLQMPRTDPALPSASSQQPPSSEPSCTSLPDTTELAELVQLATSLALASTNNVNLPNLEHIFEAAPKKAKEPSREPSQLTTEEGKLPEKPPEATEPQKAPNQGDKNFPYSYLNLSRQEGKRAAIEGKMQFLEPVTMSSELQGAEDDSVPGTKKGNPLLLKINFKLSPPQTTQK